MKKLGYLLVTLGFFAAAYQTVLDPREVATGRFLAALALAALGVGLARLAQRRAATSKERLSSDLSKLDTSLARIAQHAERLAQGRDSVDVYDLRHRIDETFTADIATFVGARESLAHRYGLQAYADVMNEFAAGERYLNRVWSASTDGYIDEAHTYLQKAADQLLVARQLLTRVQRG